VITVIVLPYLLTVTAPLLPAGPTDWLARVTPAAAFAVQQTLVQYSQVTDVYTPSAGYWPRHLEQIGPMTAGLSVQATTGLRSLPLPPWQGLGVLALWAAGALLAGGLALRLRDA
jgi:hypothetical protein